jgi:predicted nucleic acid-binding protein
MVLERSLLDCGIFLEILLAQERAGLCESALKERESQLTITDYALHAIGLVLIRNKRRDLYKEFFRDLAPRLEVLTLPVEAYSTLLDYNVRFDLDFDDAYQLSVASLFGLSLVTLDSDFKKAQNEVKIILIR